ncbi:uncharacterized protein EAE97_001635 [Botrytis byssoidea]|uniref:Uncharacterized protein n=1 Tax=Botrytis byssoidea TaxID=139641 RepID=A0A9P5IVL5_9HELO|nr:uncharacterized protein EAE97_001635 [Botrytis byssoidea]KAF7952138.1 hypothetical protein EAE97_001635 [Botrytis byssoidea]
MAYSMLPAYVEVQIPHSQLHALWSMEFPEMLKKFPPAYDGQQASWSWYIPMPWTWEAPLFSTHSSTHDGPASGSFASSNPWKLIGNISMPQFTP